MGRIKETMLKDVEEETDKPLEKRYRRKTLSMKERAAEVEKSYNEQTQANLASMQKGKNRAKGMAYFDTIISGQRLKELQKEKRKIIGHVCIMTPQELILAAGAIPVRLCSGFLETSDIAEDVLPRDICPLVKSTVGFKLLESSYFNLCSSVVIPTTCDAKKKLGEILADYMPVFMLDIPSTKDREKYKKFWLTEIKDFKKRLEKFTGNKIGKKDIKKAIDMLYERTRAVRRFYEVRKANPSVITAKDALLVINTSFFDDPARWTQKTNDLCQELEQNIKNRIGVEDPSKPRILLTGSPVIWPNFKILDIAGESGLNIVIDQVCSGSEYLYEPVEVDENTNEDMLSAIAERYLLPSVCPVFLTADDRTDRILEMAEQFQIKGVLYHVLRLCQLFDIESEGVRYSLDEKGMPMLKIITDYSSEDVEQIRTRMEAFMEMISVRGEQASSEPPPPQEISMADQQQMEAQEVQEVKNMQKKSKGGGKA